MKLYLQGCVAPVQLSPPARGRGLKLLTERDLDRYLTSPPARGRGLKLLYVPVRRWQQPVAPCAGAWIETADNPVVEQNPVSRPLRGGVD